MTHRAGAFCLTIALGVLTLPSCGGPENVSGVSGKVTLDGQPLPDAMVTFSPNKPEGSAAIGKTDSGGQYKLSYPGGFSGAHLGENRVIISTYVAGDPDADPPRPAVPEKVPAQYNTNTTLKADVKDGSNTFDWPLKSGGPIANPAAPGRADPDSCE